MDGKNLIYSLRQLLRETDGGGFLDPWTSYAAIWEAAKEFVQRTNCLRTTQSITTVADQTNYDLNADYLKLYLQDSTHRYYLKYNDGTTTTFIYFRDYEDIVLGDRTTSQSVPDGFSIIDKATLPAQLTGTATSAGALSGGQTTLTDTAATFTNVNAGDMIHNTTDRSDGIVLSKTSTTVLVTALFRGTQNDWDQSDAYVLQPQPRFQLVLDPPPLTAGHTITFYHVQSPAPVFSDYGIYRIPSKYADALVKYAAFVNMYRDKEPNFGDKFFTYWDRQVRMAAHELNQSLGRRDFTVSFKKRV